MDQSSINRAKAHEARDRKTLAHRRELVQILRNYEGTDYLGRGFRFGYVIHMTGAGVCAHRRFEYGQHLAAADAVEAWCNEMEAALPEMESP